MIYRSLEANSNIWSTNNGQLLDSAYNHGMTVSLGLYIRPERSGMNYNDEYAVKGQIEQLKQEILKYKDHPALLFGVLVMKLISDTQILRFGTQ